MLWEIVAIVGLLSTVLFCAKSVRDFFMSRRMTRNLAALTHENSAFKQNVDALTKENAALLQLKADLAAELDEFKRDLSDLKGICTLVGELNDDSVRKMRVIYERHKALVEAEVRASALRILLVLNDSLDFASEKAPSRSLVMRKLAVLFPDEPLDSLLTPEIVGNAAAMRHLVEGLLTKIVFKIQQ
jgi:predicted nuclease with TOPRIM domain